MSEEKTKYMLHFDKIRSIPFDKYEKNFTFIVNGKRYETTRVIADFPSPIICKYHYDDETISEFNIKTTTNKEIERDVFELFLKLISNDEIEVKEEERQLFNEYLLQLGNIDEYLCHEPISFTNITADQIVDRLQFLYSNLHFMTNYQRSIEQIKRMIEFASEHFTEISPDKMNNIDIDLLGEIIQNEQLKLDDEDSLLQIILAKYERNHSASRLFEYIKFNQISPSSIEEFIDHFNVDDLNTSTFRKICHCLNANKEEFKASKRYHTKYKKFQYFEGKEFNGIFKYLNDETGGNIQDNGTIEITTNSNGGYSLNELVNYQNDNCFRFNNIEDSELCFDMKDKRIQITNYSLKSVGWCINDDHLKSWVLEVSNDKKTWKKIDERSNNSQLNGPKYVATFKAQETDEFYRFIRLHQTGRNWHNSGDYHTGIVSIEFYGKLKENNK